MQIILNFKLAKAENIEICQANYVVNPKTNSKQEVNSMKNFKRILTMFLAIVMAVMTIGTTAFAAESTIADYTPVKEQIGADVSIPMRSNGPFTLINESKTITTTSSKAGKIFTSGSGILTFRATFNQVDGNTIVAIRLHNQTRNELIGEWQSSNGTIEVTINVPSGHLLQFEYLLARGTKTVTVTNYAFE